MSDRTAARLASLHIEAAAIAFITACGGNSSDPAPPTTTTTPPGSSAGNCAVPLRPLANPSTIARPPKPESTSSRRTRRGRVVEELWKHQPAGAGRRLMPLSTIVPASTSEDIGQVAVLRDESDIILPANAFDLRNIAVSFARNGSGGYDMRRSDRAFQSAVGDRVPL